MTCPLKPEKWLPQLVRCSLVRYALGEVAGGDRRRGIDHLVDGPELAADRPPSDQRTDGSEHGTGVGCRFKSCRAHHANCLVG
jgi:hypothetical protein